MAKYLVTDTELKSVADAIRTKGGTEEALVFPNGFVSAIETVPGTGNIEPITVTENGTFSPPSGVDGYAPVTVNVQSGGGSGLPDGYTELSYIESSGAQYIDTGISAPQGAKVVGELCFVQALDQYDTICGAQDSGGTTNRNAQIIRHARTDYYGKWAGTTYGSTGIPISYNLIEKILSDNRNSTCSIVDETQSKTLVAGEYTNSGRNNGNLFLFAMNDGGTANYFSAARIKHLEIYDASGTIVRDFYAAKRDSDNVLGLYDKVSSAFFTNQGSGSFISE